MEERRKTFSQHIKTDATVNAFAPGSSAGMDHPKLRALSRGGGGGDGGGACLCFHSGTSKSVLDVKIEARDLVGR